MSDLLLALDTLDVREQLTMQILPVGGELRPDLLDGESCLVISVSHFTPLATSTLDHREPWRTFGNGERGRYSLDPPIFPHQPQRYPSPQCTCP